MGSNGPTQHEKIGDIQLAAPDFTEELNLSLPCEEDDRHIAVMYCPVCKVDLCVVCCNSIHARKALSKHKPVRLTEKPEPPINCHIHPQEPAKLVCKEPSCDGMSNPMCVMCHQYETHKGHKYEILDDEHDKIRSDVANCLKENETKLAICNKNLDEYDRCISTYHRSDGNFMQLERDKIDKFYSDVRTSALKTFDDFASSKIEPLKLSKNEYSCEKIRLDEMKTLFEDVEGMRKLEVIKNGKGVERLMKQAEKQLDKPVNFIPFDCYKVEYPNVGSMNIKMAIDHQELSKYAQHRIPAVHFIYFDSSHSFFTKYALKAGNFLSVEEKSNGKLYKYKDDRSILVLGKETDVDTIDLSKYNSTAVIFCSYKNQEEACEKLDKMAESDEWYRIIVVWMRNVDYTNNPILKRVQDKSEVDKRVKAVKFESYLKLFNSLFED